MLKMIRKNTKAIIWAVILSFGLWGAYSVGIQFQKEGRIAGEVFGKSVGFQEFNRFYRASQIFSFTGKPPEDPELLKQQTWQSIIYAREAQRRKIEVSDNEVRKEVERLLKTQGIQNPTPPTYRRWLDAAVKETPQEFERQVRDFLRIQKLILSIHTQAITLPSREEALRRFLLESQTLNAEAVRFETYEKASTLYKALAGSKKWRKEIDKNRDLKLLTTGNLSLQDLIRQWQVSEEEAFQIHRLRKGGVSAPVSSGSGYAIFYLLDKADVSEEKFDKETEKKYLETLTNQRKYERFVQWNLELQERAHLKDYLPRSENANPSSP
jgi:hypothetical protein